MPTGVGCNNSVLIGHGGSAGLGTLRQLPGAGRGHTKLRSSIGRARVRQTPGVDAAVPGCTDYKPGVANPATVPANSGHRSPSGKQCGPPQFAIGHNCVQRSRRAGTDNTFHRARTFSASISEHHQRPVVIGDNIAANFGGRALEIS